MKTKSECKHLPEKYASPKTKICKECTETFNLRVCMTCGHVGCCESDPGQHAKKHSDKTGHKIIKSYPPDQKGAFTWCYACNDYIKDNK